MKENHCKDCCCAKSWEALGITEYTGRSIPEHIKDMRETFDRIKEIDFDDLLGWAKYPDGSPRRWQGAKEFTLPLLEEKNHD